MFTISLCMIVKNESDVLSRLLSCAKKFADEIIIVDTGSTDNTKEIASSFTDKVYDFKWVDDFSKARNYSFSFATCDYQMWLDADDFITDKNIEAIQSLKQSDKNADVFMFKYSMGFDEENKPSLSYFRERLLKRNKNFKWQGFVHEAITPSGNVEYTNIEIEHRKIHEHEKGRNLKLFQTAIKNNIKLQPREIYYYARELFYNNKIEEAVEKFKEYLEIPNTFTPDNIGAHILLSECYKNLKQDSLALDTLFLAIKKHIPTAELCCKIAYLFDSQNKKEQAIFWFKAALISPCQTEGFVNEDYLSFFPNLELSRLLFQTNFNEAQAYHFKAKSLHPKHPAIVFNSQFFEH